MGSAISSPPPRPARRRGLLAAAALLALAPGCDHAAAGAAGVPPSGALAVTIDGLPSGIEAAVTVRGPGGFSRAVPTTATLASLAPGRYTVAALPTAAGGGAPALSPSPASQTVDVGAGATASATVTYTAFALALRQVVGGLASPVHLTAPAGDARLFVVEQGGRIRIVRGGALLATPFLDISAKVQSGGERGLLSMAFDPAYATNGFFYVYYTNGSGDIVVERYGGAPGADVASPTPTPVITIPHPGFANHNGGLLLFGPDGMLYLGTGDGGGAGDPPGNAQNTGSLLGKLLRLDVRALPYSVPPSNPFAGQAGKRGEIWAYGLRNPWRYDFDTPPGAGSTTLYVADVGQSAWEEVNVAPAAKAGVNYGWRVMEGTHCYPAGSACSGDGLQRPVVEYDHSQGCSITGGSVYRGAALPELAGHYFYSDYCGGWLASMTGDATQGFTTGRWSVPNVGSVTSFGEDAAGELYMLTAGGTVYQLVRG